MGFQKATKRQSRLRLGLMGPPGAGKTYSALRIARGMGGKVGVIDTERGSASKYADEFEFETLELESFAPREYVKAIHEAERAGIEVLIIDSLSHAWTGKDGALEQVDRAAAKMKSSNTFTAWRDVTPEHNAMVDAILQSKCHVILTLRTKTEYVLETDSRGKQVPRKVGMAPIQRDGLEYECDVVGDFIDNAKLAITKTRCKALREALVSEPGEDFGKQLKAWLTDGAPALPSANGITSKAVLFGEWKGKSIASLSDQELTAAIAKGQEEIEKAPKTATWVPKIMANVVELEDELSVRMGPPAPHPNAEREPEQSSLV